MSAAGGNHSDCPEVKVPVPLFFTIGVVSLAENLLVVVAVIRNRNLHSPMYCFICSLAAFNTIASLTKTWENLMIVLAAGGHLEKRGPSETNLDDVMDSLLYITIFHALRYHNIMTMRRTKAALAVVWTTCGVSAVLMVRFFASKLIMILFVVFFVVSLAIICFLYVYMFMLARIHARKIAALPSGGGGGKRRRRWGSGMRGALTLTILFGVFVVCWAPFFLHLVIIVACPADPYCECYRSLFQLHVVLLMSHASIDPAIYAFRSAELRRTFRKMLLCSHRAQVVIVLR
ncbi:Adrenocorticotropic hormone receptor [Liparis tanakae]|uniref:Adrenocorticotropic hormone receptor n=1 Tax=Liparis tanakae TaxID=230148 RepID=A0A4Z2INR9_9TELE|nr:Adrenocorticotropic hormone receptor [Liparis tanakae]